MITGKFSPLDTGPRGHVLSSTNRALQSNEGNPYAEKRLPCMDLLAGSESDPTYIWMLIRTHYNPEKCPAGSDQPILSHSGQPMKSLQTGHGHNSPHSLMFPHHA